MISHGSSISDTAYYWPELQEKELLDELSIESQQHQSSHVQATEAKQS